MLHLDIALATPEHVVQIATSAIQQVSDPTSPLFGQHWSAGHVAQLFRPSADAVGQVLGWLNASNVPRTAIWWSPGRGHIYLSLPAKKAEALLHTQYQEFSNKETNRTQVASRDYKLPVSVSEHVDFVLPSLLSDATMSFPQFQTVSDLPRTKRQAPRVIDCFRYLSPACLRELYNISLSDQPPHPNNSFGIFLPSWETWLPDDLDQFFSDFQPELRGKYPTILPIDGGYRQFELQIWPFNLEANLDFSYAMSLSYPQEVINMQVGDYYQLGNLNTMLAAFDQSYCDALENDYDPQYPDLVNPGGWNATADCGKYKPPLVISTSYVHNEAEYPDGYAKRQCLEFLKLGLQGVTVIAATGDGGVADQLQGCIDPESGAWNASVGHFSSTFPASCPWVTAVGGTQFAAPTTNNTTNKTWSPGTPFPEQTAYYRVSETAGGGVSSSGGGFSRLFKAPFYQAHDTRAYLSAQQTHVANFAAHFNAAGRGYPDVSLMAANYLIVLYGQLRSVFGTSASAPVFASMIARINDARLKAGKSSVGLVNPVLYKYKEMLNDVDTGMNTGCGTSEAYRAEKGWDPVTGLGTPDFQKLLDLYLSLP